MTFTPTAQQKRIIEEAAKGTDLVIEALAGTGKSTTLRLIAESQPHRSFRYVVFNKSQQEEAASKMPKNVEARTGNSLAWEFVNSVYQKHKVDLPKRLESPAGQYLTTGREIAEHFKIQRYEITRTVKPQKGAPFELKETLSPAKAIAHLKKAIQKFCISTDPELTINHFDPTISYPGTAASDARRLWSDLSDIYGRMQISHDHIVKLWAKSFRDLSISIKNAEKTFDVLMIDEAQDTNPVFGGVYAQQTRMQRIYVGDQYQAIYGFRGAEDELQKVEITTRLPLTESWRFGPGIAKPANLFLAKLGSDKTISGMREEFGVIAPTGSMFLPEVVLCRTNAGALRAIFERIDAGQVVKVGKDYKKDLLSLLDTLAWFFGFLSKKPKIHADLEKYSSMEELQEAIDDKEETRKITELFTLIKEKGYQPVRAKLESLDGYNRKDSIEVITAHKAKGSEWDRVQIYTDFWGYRTDSETGEKIPPKDEEFRLAYVSVTRAMKEIDLGSLSYIMKSNSDDDDEDC